MSIILGARWALAEPPSPVSLPFERSAVSTLPEILTSSVGRPAAVRALADVVEDEVRRKSGVGGMALKAGFAAAAKMRPDLVPHAIDKMLPEFAERLDPYWQQRGEQPFGAYLQGHSEPVSDALLGVTDARLQNPNHAALAKIYAALRPKARSQVAESLPRLGAAIESLAR